MARIREARRRLAADGPPRVRSGGDFERVSVPVPTPLSRPPLLHLDSPPAGRFLDLAYILPSLDHLPAPMAAERTSQVTGFIIRACSDQSRLMESDPPARPVLSVDDFTVNLVDTILAILQAPTSVATGPAATEG